MNDVNAMIRHHLCTVHTYSLTHIRNCHLTNCRKSNEHWCFLSNMLKNLCLAVLCNIMCDLKEAIRTCTWIKQRYANILNICDTFVKEQF